jgi:hypothetical protein
VLMLRRVAFVLVDVFLVASPASRVVSIESPL